METHKPRGGAYWISGGRSNDGFVVGPQGVVVLETGISAAEAKMAQAEIAKVTSEPVSAIVVTHADPDHVLGLLYYRTSTPVFIQENARSEVVAAANDPAPPPAYKALYTPLVERLPRDTVGRERVTTLGRVRVVLIHVAPAHTAGDIIMYLPDTTPDRRRSCKRAMRNAERNTRGKRRRHTSELVKPPSCIDATVPRQAPAAEVFGVNGDLARRKPLTKEKTYWDDDLTGFGLRVRPSGCKSWVVKFVSRGRQKKLTLGRCEDIQPWDPRQMARKILADVATTGLPKR